MFINAGSVHVADGAAHVDEVVRDPLDVGGEGEELRTDGGLAGPLGESYDVVVRHGIGDVVDVLLDGVRLPDLVL